MKAWRHWIGLVAIWVAPPLGHAMTVRIAPESGAFQDESGHRSTTADATTFATGLSFPWGTRTLFSPYFEFEMASQAFSRSQPSARTLAILDQRGAGLGLAVDYALADSRFWRTETSVVMGENHARTAATYATRQEATTYTAPYRRALIATGFVLPATGALSLGIMGGWREARLEQAQGETEVSGSQARQPGGLTLTYDRVSLEERDALRGPTSLSGWFIRLGVEARL